jgi:transcriptional regulator with XRE-family HTH domain
MFASTEVRSVPTAALSTTPLSGQTFDTVMGKVSTSSELALPDQVLPISQLRATDDGFIDVPSVGMTSLTDWSRRQLAGRLGIRWDRWFSEDLVVPADRAAEINLRFQRSTDSLKIRTRRWAAGEEAKGEAVLRALVSPTYAPIDDLNVFEVLRSVLGGRLQELCFVRLDVTDESSQYAAVNREDVDLGIAKPDHHRNGFIIANSETGSRSLTLLVWIWRLVCTNGLIAPESSVFRMVHRRQKDGVMQEKLARAVRLLPEYWSRAERTLRNARRDPVEDPHAALEVMVTAHPQLRPISDSVYEAYEQDPEPNRFGLVQAITRAAQALRPEDRLTVEEFAGRIASMAPMPEVAF